MSAHCEGCRRAARILWKLEQADAVRALGKGLGIGRWVELKMDADADVDVDMEMVGAAGAVRGGGVRAWRERG